MNNRLGQVAGWISVLFFGLPGLYAFLAPESFHNNIATFPPFSRHLVHDMGAFMVGLAVVMLVAMIVPDALTAAFAGIATGAILSGIAHILDRDLGGRWIVDVLSLFGLAALVIAALVSRWRAFAAMKQPASS